VTDMRTPERPQPAPDDLSSVYWNACHRGELLIQRCPACGHRQFYPRHLCTVCAATPEWETTSGRGRIYTFTVIRQNYAKPFRELLPYVVAMVELAEGPMLMGNVTDCAIEDVSIGMDVEAWFDEASEDVSVPYWRPAR
jgi:uncharacterized OB-fold protein